LTLRRKLLLALIVVAGAGLVATDIALYIGVRSYLYTQIDKELLELSNSSSRALGQACNSSSISNQGPGGPITGVLPNGSWVAFTSNGQVVCQGFLNAELNGTTPAPHLPGAFGSAAGATPYGVYFGTSSGPGGAPYRMVAFAGTASNGLQEVSGTLIVAIPSSDAEQTLGQVFYIELIATLTVIVALAVVAWSIIRISLKPLDDMTKTADAIAAGDLSQRVKTSDPRTEVGRLGAALNTMLSQIETAFAARARSESRLRRFVADASHELRTPLTSIRGYAELFRRGAANRPEDLANSMRRIEEEAARMGVLVDDLLQLARLDIAASEEQSTPKSPVDLASLARDAVSDQRAADPAHPIELHADESRVEGDEAGLRRVIANLLANASQHTAAGTAVTVTTGADPATRTAFVEVADAGPGMTAEDASHAFERFWRADPARTRGGSGAGLGLAIVAAIVSSHEGRVTLETSPGNGCRFRVILPAAGERHDRADRPTPTMTPDATVVSTGAGEMSGGYAG
jgi:two-component system OmpR family sensor kinase